MSRSRNATVFDGVFQEWLIKKKSRQKTGDIKLAKWHIVRVTKWRPPAGCHVKRLPLNGCIWNCHLVDHEYRCKIIGKELWPLQKGEKVDPATIRTITRTERVGRELISTIKHWWLDKEIIRPQLQREDWDFSPLKNSQYDWQLSASRPSRRP